MLVYTPGASLSVAKDFGEITKNSNDYLVLFVRKSTLGVLSAPVTASTVILIRFQLPLDFFFCLNGHLERL
ncbi:hypothetical protein [Bacillus salipaludis]|uniref:hypothetical protein n=1 Tax=Bacillus salipaludis TaxID=2547811 RepID=UPI002E1B6BF3|nr:hypothetical protein [Bacillus salipaludis]